ncbi:MULTISPECIES: hypothetical protein [Acinetobacter]|uniref:hypothetical protein n=1 Tax=Acinetobacter TaxID=469 RepID=UPI001957B47F|nr:hypothetical protein [Acinetobacter sp. 105-3]MBM7139702.1 hypothetical protein [Acinetobacter sp. 105-3]
MILNLKLAPLINLFIRAFTLLGKFILLFYMAKFLTQEEVGLYGLFVVLVGYSLYAVGFDFYTFSTRELVLKDKTEWGVFIKSQGYLIGIAYFIILPIILYISSYSIPLKWLYFLGGLIVLEHLNQEIMRLLIIDKKAVLANNLLFIRSGLWCYLIIGSMFFSLVNKNLENIVYTWLAADLIALIWGWIKFKKDIKFVKKQDVQYNWLKTGLKICIPLLFSTLILRAITTVDRLWLEHLEGLGVIAAYSLFFGLTNAMLSFLDTGVFSFIYPHMIKEKNNTEKFNKLVKKMFLQTIGLTLFISVSLIVIFPYLLNWIGKDIYFTYRNIFYIILTSNILYCIGMVPHYILYAKGDDRKIIISHVVGLIVFFFSTLICIYNNIAIPVAYGLCFSFLSILIAKLLFSIEKSRFKL